MIEQAVMDVLVAVTAIKARISTPGAGERIYHGRIREGVKIDGGAIVVKKLASSHEYGLQAEEASRFTTLTIDCYDTTPANAASLGDLVAAAISGAAAIGLACSPHHINTSLIVNERTQFEKPQGATDDWRPRDSRDYRIHHHLA